MPHDLKALKQWKISAKYHNPRVCGKFHAFGLLLHGVKRSTKSRIVVFASVNQKKLGLNSGTESLNVWQGILGLEYFHDFWHIYTLDPQLENPYQDKKFLLLTLVLLNKLRCHSHF